MSCCPLDPLYQLDHGKPLTQGHFTAITKPIGQAAPAAEDWTRGLIVSLDPLDGIFKPWDGSTEDQQIAVLQCCASWDGVAIQQPSTLILKGNVLDSLLYFPGFTAPLTPLQIQALQVWGLTVIPQRDLSRTTGDL